MTGDGSPSPARLDLAGFRQKLDAIADTTTIGVATADGVSPKNAQLERLAWSISALPDAAEQAKAIAEVLRVSNQLPYDQDAHVIATMIHDLVMPRRIMLHDGAQPAVGAALLRAGLAVAPHLVPQSVGYVVLKLHLHRLVLRQEYAFGDEVYDQFDEVGFNNPALTVPDAVAAEQSVLHKTEWLRSQIAHATEKQIDPATLAAIVDQAEALPDELRGSVLTTLVNAMWNTSRDPGNTALNDRIRALVQALPPSIGITPLEALYNQLILLPHEQAAALHPAVLAAVQALPTEDAVNWFARSRADLIASLHRQRTALADPDLRPGESLMSHDERVGLKTSSISAALFTQMRRGNA